MKVFKFGGASIADASAIKNVVKILKKFISEKPLIVISASGKTTNALEKVVNDYWENNGNAFNSLEIVKNNHQQIIRELFSDSSHPIFDEINDLFVDVEWILEETAVGSYDQIYDQIVSLGELLSTKIISDYLNENNINSIFLDVRDCILTDNNYRDANIEWEETEKRIKKIVPPLIESAFVITQGFIGITSENFTTTLGREGSDFTAAVFSYSLNAESMTIWKDVPGVLNADPRVFNDTVLLSNISYAEAIEMTYYGAQVIHPKTLRPLQNKYIPLYVKSFINPDDEGTLVSDKAPNTFPPVFVVKNNQTLLNIYSKSFYFVDESKFSKLFDAFARHRVKVNMTQNTALAFSVSVNNDHEKLKKLIGELNEEYDIDVTENLKLLTIRHGDEASLKRMYVGKKILLEERIRNTVQLLMSEDEKISL